SIALMASLFFGANASATVTTPNGGSAQTYVYCHPYQGYIGTNTQMLADNDFLSQAVDFILRVERWTGSAWVTYAQTAPISTGSGYGFYPYAFRVRYGTYRLHIDYGWLRNGPDNEFIHIYKTQYSQYGSTYPSRNRYYVRNSAYCYA